MEKREDIVTVDGDARNKEVINRVNLTAQLEGIVHHRHTSSSKPTERGP